MVNIVALGQLVLLLRLESKSDEAKASSNPPPFPGSDNFYRGRAEGLESAANFLSQLVAAEESAPPKES